MKNYNFDLLKNEEVVYETGVHISIFFKCFIAIMFAGIFANSYLSFHRLSSTIGGSVDIYNQALMVIVVVLLLIFFIGTWIEWKKSIIVVTNERILFRTGWIRQNVGEIFLAKLTGIIIEQDMVGRLFNYGTIKINGDNATHQPLKLIANPEELKRQVLNQIHKEG